MALGLRLRRWLSRTELQAQELKALRKELQRVSARMRQAEEAVSRARLDAKGSERASRDREKLDEVVRDRTRLKRKMLSPVALAGVLQARKAKFPPASWRAEADAREARFRETSPDYARVADELWPRPGVQPVDIDGLRLWVALDERLPERAERAAKQDIPFGAILQSREVAIGGIMLDIGANIGRTSLPRVLLGDVRAVYGAEADADNYACLLHAVIDNGLRGFVLPDHVAIAAEDGTARLRRSRYIGGHRLYTGSARPDVELVDVRTRRLDTWVTEHGIDPDAVSFVKVDVQGWEPGVIKGGPALLARGVAAWQLEVDPHLLRIAGSSVREIIELVQPHFTHFIDLRAEAPGPRHRPIQELAEALGYLPDDSSDGTDVLFYARKPLE